MTPTPTPGLRRVLVVQREHNDQPVPASRRTGSTALVSERVRAALRAHGVEPVGLGASSADLVLVLGGDGTILRACEIARDLDVPLVGINTGHVGFLAEADPHDVEQVVADLVAGRYTVDERMTIDIEVENPDGSIIRGWALNEAALDKRDRARMLQLAIGVDGQAVSSFGCDSLLFSTPTGSTAYAFSAGGPVIWPEVEALLLVPVAAHALFTRPLVVGPRSCLEVHVKDTGLHQAEIWCDGRRMLPVPIYSIVRVRRGERTVRLARLNDAPFSERLVRKLALPVAGWRETSPQSRLSEGGAP